MCFFFVLDRLVIFDRKYEYRFFFVLESDLEFDYDRREFYFRVFLWYRSRVEDCVGSFDYF